MDLSIIYHTRTQMPCHLAGMPHLQVGGTELYYEVHGEGPGTPVVWVMGLGTDLHAWEPQLEALVAREPARRHLVLDNRGVGRSGKPPGPYTTVQMADDVVAVMRELGFARAHVIGISLGGAIAQEIALRHPERVATLVLIATFARFEKELARTADEGARQVGVPISSVMSAWASADPAAAPAIEPKLAYKFLMPLVFSREFLERERALLRSMFERAMGYGFSSTGLAAQVAAAMAHDALDRLERIEAPTLVVTGTADALVPPEHSRRIAERIRGARLEAITGGTHGLTIEFAAPLNQLLGSWLDEHAAV
jgi:pimeloyl-ACP methyl ester carboxylesterase